MAKDVAPATSATPAVTEDVHPLVTAIKESQFFQEEMDAMTMAMSLLEAPDADALLHPNTDGEVTHAEDVLSKPFMLHGVKFNPSDINPDWPLYAILDVSWNGEKDVMSCGSLAVCVAAYKLATEDWLPRMVKIIRNAKPTRSGYYPLNLVAADEEDPNQGTLNADAEPF